MKKKLLFAAGLSLMMISFHSCDQLKNCQVCSENSYNSSNVLISQQNEAEYCDADLISIKAKIPVTIGGTTTKWECR
jgi:hypothetical protein